MVHCSAVFRSCRRGGKFFFISLNKFQSRVEYTCVSLAHVFSNKIFMLFHSKNWKRGGDLSLSNYINEYINNWILLNIPLLNLLLMKYLSFLFALGFPFNSHGNVIIAGEELRMYVDLYSTLIVILHGGFFSLPLLPIHRTSVYTVNSEEQWHSHLLSPRNGLERSPLILVTAPLPNARQ